MKLKKLLEGFAWERKPGQPLTTLKDTSRAHSLKEANGEGFDYDYFIGQIEAAQEAVDEAVGAFTKIIDDIEDLDEKNRILRGNGLKVEQLKGELMTIFSTEELKWKLTPKEVAF